MKTGKFEDAIYCHKRASGTSMILSAMLSGFCIPNHLPKQPTPSAPVIYHVIKSVDHTGVVGMSSQEVACLINMGYSSIIMHVLVFLVNKINLYKPDESPLYSLSYNMQYLTLIWFDSCLTQFSTIIHLSTKLSSIMIGWIQSDLWETPDRTGGCKTSPCLERKSAWAVLERDQMYWLEGPWSSLNTGTLHYN